MDFSPTMDSTSTSLPLPFAPDVSPAIDDSLVIASAIQANEAHRAALTSRRNMLRQQLEDASIMLKLVEKDVNPKIEEIELKDTHEWAVFAMPGATSVKPYLTSRQLHAEDSPFRKDSLRRRQYLADTTSRPFTAREKTNLRQYVIAENKRLLALDMHKRNEPDALDKVSRMPDSDFDKDVERIDWERIATNMADGPRTHHAKRTALEFRAQYIGSDHPLLRNPAVWDEEDDQLLMELVEGKDVRAGEVNWAEVAKEFQGTRSPAHLLSRCLMLDELARAADDSTPASTRGAWTAEEDEDLHAAVEEHGAGNWAAVSLLLSNNRSPAACYFRYTQTLQPTIKRGTWTPAEDTKLRDAVALYGQKWSRVKELLPGRTGAQCRERFVRVLCVQDAKHGHWTQGEDDALREAILTHRLKDWELIAKRLGGRTGVQCRKRWARISSSKDTTPSSSKDSVPEQEGGASDDDGDAGEEGESSTAPAKEKGKGKEKEKRPRPKPKPRYTGPTAGSRGKGKGQETEEAAAASTVEGGAGVDVVSRTDGGHDTATAVETGTEREGAGGGEMQIDASGGEGESSSTSAPARRSSRRRKE